MADGLWLEHMDVWAEPGTWWMCGYPCRCGTTNRIGADSSERLGWHRWIVERTIACLLTFSA